MVLPHELIVLGSLLSQGNVERLNLPLVDCLYILRHVSGLFLISAGGTKLVFGLVLVLTLVVKFLQNLFILLHVVGEVRTNLLIVL